MLINLRFYIRIYDTNENMTMRFFLIYLSNRPKLKIIFNNPWTLLLLWMWILPENMSFRKCFVLPLSSVIEALLSIRKPQSNIDSKLPLSCSESCLLEPLSSCSSGFMRQNLLPLFLFVIAITGGSSPEKVGWTRDRTDCQKV